MGELQAAVVYLLDVGPMEQVPDHQKEQGYHMMQNSAKLSYIPGMMVEGLNKERNCIQWEEIVAADWMGPDSQ